MTPVRCASLGTLCSRAGLGDLAGPQPSGWTQGRPRRGGMARPHFGFEPGLPGGRAAITGVSVFRLD
jgi:hypothetical protein